MLLRFTPRSSSSDTSLRRLGPGEWWDLLKISWKWCSPQMHFLYQFRLDVMLACGDLGYELPAAWLLRSAL